MESGQRYAKSKAMLFFEKRSEVLIIQLQSQIGTKRLCCLITFKIPYKVSNGYRILYIIAKYIK